jgi:RNA polymerase sigma-70 factor, ECF subfamily
MASEPIPFPGLEHRAGAAADDGTDTRLLAELAQGQAGALAELYRRRGGVLLSLLIRILGDDREAEEVLQDTFIQLWRKADQYNPAKSGPLTWMVMIARGLALDRLRRRNRLSTVLDEYRASRLPDADVSFPATGEAETTERVSHALAGLPGEQREALELAFWRGCTQEEIARVTGSPLGTVKARLRRAMMSLRTKLKDRHE